MKDNVHFCGLVSYRKLQKFEFSGLYEKQLFGDFKPMVCVSSTKNNLNIF